VTRRDARLACALRSFRKHTGSTHAAATGGIGGGPGLSAAVMLYRVAVRTENNKVVEIVVSSVPVAVVDDKNFGALIVGASTTRVNHSAIFHP
jgi:hypothetical protein